MQQPNKTRALLEGYANTMRNLSVLVKSQELNSQLLQAADLCVNCLRSRGKILIAGNGGSHCSALHFAEELTGRFRKDRPPLAAMALGEASHASCTSNDYGAHQVFARQVEAFIKPEDILLLLSTSGNSENLNLAWAYHKGCCIAFLGKGGGNLGRLLRDQDLKLVFPGETSDRIQELHMLSLHLLVEMIEREMFPKLYEDVSYVP